MAARPRGLLPPDQRDALIEAIRSHLRRARPARAPDRDGQVYTKPFILTALANFLVFTNLNVYTLLPLYIKGLGGREGQIGNIMAMYTLAAVLCQVGMGSLLDRFGRRRFMLAAAGAVTLVSIAFALSRSLGWHFYALRFVQGIAFAVFLTSNLALIADLAPPSRRAEAVGIFGVSGLVTIAVAPAIGEVVVRARGFHALFAGSIVVGLAGLAVCLATVVPEAPAVEAPGRLGAAFWSTFTPILVTALQFGLANSIVFVFLPPFAPEAGVGRIGPFYVIYTAAAVGVRFFGGWLADRFGRWQVILPSLVGLTSGVLLFSVLHSTWLLLLIGLINGASHGFLYPATSALAVDMAPVGARGRALAAYNMAALGGGAIGAIGFGWLAQWLGYRPAFLVTGLVLALGVLHSLRERRRARSAAPGLA
jgi:MFS family permease